MSAASKSISLMLQAISRHPAHRFDITNKPCEQAYDFFFASSPVVSKVWSGE